jgi:ATP-dependent DNA helicase RecG
MYAEMTRLGHHPPVFESDHYRVTVTLNGGAPNTAVTRFVATLPVDHWSDPDTLLVLFSLLTKRTVTADQLAGTLQKHLTEVEIVLRQLAAPPVELIERTRESTRMRQGVYRLRGHALAQLGTAVTYWRRADDEIDRKVIEIVRETTQINSRMVRTLLDVDTPTASRILGDLVERGVLVKTSTAQRGPAVTYGPGPQFPHRGPRGGTR